MKSVLIDANQHCTQSHHPGFSMFPWIFEYARCPHNDTMVKKTRLRYVTQNEMREDP